MTFIIMLILSVLLFLLLVLRDEAGKNNRFFDLDTTSCMRGFWCIVILLVHIPLAYQNTIQDAIGSFAYIGVTFFFMTSGYGLMLKGEKRQGESVWSFWVKRLPKLIVPMLFVNVIRFFVELFAYESASAALLIGITGFVRQLLLFYFLFWIVFYLLPHGIAKQVKMLLLSFLIICFSFFVYFFGGLQLFGWPVESFGFLYGILLAEAKTTFVEWGRQKRYFKILAFGIASLGLGVVYLKFKAIPFLGDFVIRLLLGFFILMLILLLNVNIPIGNKMSRWLGKISYEVYLIHDVSFVILIAWFSKLNSGLFVSLSIIITILLSILVKKLSAIIYRLFGFKTRCNFVKKT